MKQFSRIILVAFFLTTFFTCKDGSLLYNHTDVDLVTGIVVRNAYANTTGTLGNPNVFDKTKFNAYPNLTYDFVNLSAADTITEIWIVAAKGRKKFKNDDFDLILSSNLYDENQIVSCAIDHYTNLNSQNLQLNLSDFDKGYYKVFVKVGENIYCDNIYVAKSESDIDKVYKFWD